MIRRFKVSIASTILAATLLTPVAVFAQVKNAPTAGPSDKAIAAAKARGLVWVPKNTKLYCKDGEAYGKGQGEFMPETEAQKAGNHEQKPDGKK